MNFDASCFGYGEVLIQNGKPVCCVFYASIDYKQRDVEEKSPPGSGR